MQERIRKINYKDAQKTIKEYEYLLNEKQSTLDNYIKYLDTACKLVNVDKVQIIEIVRNKNSYKKFESIINILDQKIYYNFLIYYSDIISDLRNKI